MGDGPLGYRRAMADVQQESAARAVRRQTGTRAAILAATEAVLVTSSLDDVSVAEIARRAGVSRASVFGHFGSKDGLVAAAVEQIAGAAIAGMQAAYDADGTAFDRVMASGSAYLELLIDHPALLRYLIARAMRTSANPIDQRVDDLVDQLRDEFESQIQAAIDAGEVHPLNPRLLAHFLFGAWPGAIALALGPAESGLSTAEVRAVVATALDVLERGLRAGPATGCRTT